MQEAIDILIPTYKRVKDLKRALDSLVPFIDEEFISSVIVSDNDSQDGTIDLIPSYQKKYSKIKLVSHSKNIGAIKNVIGLVDLAEAEHVCFLTDDDYFIGEVSSYFKSFLRSGADFSKIPVVIHLEKQNTFNTYVENFNQQSANSFAGRNVALEILKKSHILSGVIFRKKLAQEILQEVDLTNHWYPHQFIVSELIKKNRRYFYSPQISIVHTWENEIHWGDLANETNLNHSQLSIFQNLVNVLENYFIIQYLFSQKKIKSELYKSLILKDRVLLRINIVKFKFISRLKNFVSRLLFK